MANEYNKVILQIEQERYAICEINGIFAMLGIISWLGPSYLALAALSMILVLNAAFPFVYRRKLLNSERSRPGAPSIKRSAAYERYMISVVNAIFALLGIVSWWDLSWLAFVALILVLTLNLSFPFQHHRSLREAKRKQIDCRLQSLLRKSLVAPDPLRAAPPQPDGPQSAAPAHQDHFLALILGAEASRLPTVH
jgi:hypothetical protein